MQPDRLVVAVIPARGGSRGVPRKNVKELGGKPLLRWSIDAARAATSIDLIVVSTEDPEIAALARTAGVDVVNRPPHLATDTVRLDGTIVHVTEVLERRGLVPTLVVTLQPTSPFRRAADIDLAADILETSGSGSLLSVRPVDCSPELMLRLGDRAVRFDETLAKPYRRQDWAPVYQPSGAIYASSAEQLATGRVLEPEPAYLVMSGLGCDVDLDTPLDFAIAETLLKHHPELCDPDRPRGEDEVAVRWPGEVRLVA